MGKRDRTCPVNRDISERGESGPRWVASLALRAVLMSGPMSGFMALFPWLLIPPKAERIGLYRADPTPHWLQY